MTSSASRIVRDTWALIRRDPVFWVACGLFVVAVFPYAVPILEDWQFYNWRWSYSDVPVSIATLLVVWVGVSQVVGPTERTFWYLVAAAHGVVAVIETANAFVPDALLFPLLEISVYSGYLLFYLGLLLAAAASQGYLARDGSWRLQRLRTVGLGVVGVTFIVYFEAVPYVANPDITESWYPGLFLYAALDAVIALLFLRGATVHDDPRWVGILRGMAAVSVLYAITDGAEAVLMIDRFADLELAPLWDLAWYPPSLLLVLVARRYLTDPQPTADPPLPPPPPEDRGVMVVGLLTLPALHVMLYATSVLDPALRVQRDAVIGVFLVVMGALTVRYFQRLEEERDQGQRSLELSEERYRTFVHLRTDVVLRGECAAPIPVGAPASEQVDALLDRVRIAEARGESGVHPEMSVTMGSRITDVLPEAGRRDFLLRWVEAGYRDEMEQIEEFGTGGSRCFRYVLTGIVDDDLLRRIWLTRSDITEQRRTSVENRRLQDELERARKLESLGRLAGGIAHDFNNLLAPIVGYTELARDDIGSDDQEARDSLRHVLSAAGRASDLVDQVLSVSRQQPRASVPVRVQETVEEVVALLRPGIPLQVAIDVSVDPACPPVIGDPSRIHQILMNLCTNAAHAIGPGPGLISIRLGSDHEGRGQEAPGGYVRLEVTDDGPGVPADVASRVFDPFFTTKPVGQGTGLGLSVVHGIAISHGGRVELDSSPEEGTKVSVFLPAADSDAFQPVAPPSQPDAPSCKRILVVDDESAVAKVTRRSLTALGHEVSVATDAMSALEQLSHPTNAIDLLVTDYAMPDMTGVELVERVRAVRPDISVVLMSGYKTDGASALSNVAMLRKPFTRGELATAIAAAVVAPQQGVRP